MKQYTLLTMLVMMLTANIAKAQYDDIYYDPSRDTRKTTTSRSSSKEYKDDANDNAAYDEQYYEGDDYYEYDEDYDDYQYSSRIRRFHRPYRGFNFYDHAYVDNYYYDPYYYDRFFMRPTIIVGFGNSYWNRWDRYNRWNSWGWYDRYWGNYCFNYDSYYRPFNSLGWNSWSNDPWFYNGGYWGNNYYNYYYPRYSYPYYNSGNFFQNNQGNNGIGLNTSNPKGTHYGPRRSTTLNSPVSPTGISTGNGRSGSPNRDGSGVQQPTNGPTKNRRSGEAAANETRRAPEERVIDNGRSTNTPNETTKAPRQRQKYTTESSDSDERPLYQRPSRERQSDTEGGTVTRPQREAPQRGQEERRRPAMDDERPLRTYETRPERPTRTYDAPRRSAESETPSRTYERPSRSETPRQSEQRSTPRYESPRYEAPRQETRSYSPPAQQQSAPARSSESGGNTRSNGRSGGRDQ